MKSEACGRQSRRNFLRSVGLMACATGLAYAQSIPGRSFKAAIIGHTGHGDYGHDHDLIFQGRSNVRVVAIADPDETGRMRALARVQCPRGYADYRELIEKERPDLVSIASRCSAEHHAIALAALRAGAHIYVEKPFTRTLAEADELLAVAKAQGLKIAVPHQLRLAPNILLLKKEVDSGMIGDLIEIRAHGKEDKRAGGEDLVVLGVHLFDLMRLFAGEPAWCSARILQNGQEITLQDAHPATEAIGPIAGDDIIAQFEFTKGTHATFVSRSKNQPTAGPWGMELIGSKGSVRIHTQMAPRIYFKRSGVWSPKGSAIEWQVWEKDPTTEWDASQRTAVKANERVTNDWLEAIVENREPRCSGERGMKALEMALAVFEAGLTKRRVEFPMKKRSHPLES